MSRILRIEIDLDSEKVDDEIKLGIDSLCRAADFVVDVSYIDSPCKLDEHEHGRDTVGDVVHAAAAPVTVTGAGAPPPPPAQDKEKGESSPAADDKSKGESAPPPPPPATTSAGAPPPPPPATTQEAEPEVDLDSEGLPWDGRIHAASKKKLVKGGTWKLKRNLDPAMLAQVKAELGVMMQAPATEPGEPNPKEIFGGAPAATVNAQEAETDMTFIELMQYITDRITQGTLKQEDLDNVQDKHGIPNPTLLASRPDMIPAFYADLEAV